MPRLHIFAHAIDSVSAESRSIARSLVAAKATPVSVRKVVPPGILFGVALLKVYLKSANSRSADIKERLSRLRQAHKDAEAGIVRLLTLVEQGVMDAEDGSLRERLVGLKVRRDELAAEVADLQKRLASGEPVITSDKIAAFATLLRDRLRNGPPDFKQAYVRLIIQEVSVGDKEIRISGSKAILARAASDGLDKTAPGVLSFVQEWRAGADEDENFRFIIKVD